MPGVMSLIERRGKTKGTGFMRYKEKFCISSNVPLERSLRERIER